MTKEEVEKMLDKISNIISDLNSIALDLIGKTLEMEKEPKHAEKEEQLSFEKELEELMNDIGIKFDKITIIKKEDK